MPVFFIYATHFPRLHSRAVVCSIRRIGNGATRCRGGFCGYGDGAPVTHFLTDVIPKKVPDIYVSGTYIMRYLPEAFPVPES